MGYYCKWLWLISLILSTLLSITNCYIITVDAHSEECFFETVKADTKIRLTFEIIEGGFLDIDIKITGPDGAVIYRGEEESSGMYTFSAPTSGRYTYCFSNQKTFLSSKVLMFNLEVGEAVQKNTGDKEEKEEVNHNKLEDMIKELGSTTRKSTGNITGVLR